MSPALRGAAIAVSLALCLAGIGTMTQGVAVPVTAKVAQRSLEDQFEQRLARHTASALRGGNRSPGGAAGAVDRLEAGLGLDNRSPETTRSARTDPDLPLPTEGPIARLSVERLGIEEIVLAGEATADRLAKGPTALKLGDPPSPVTILAAHRDTHFLFIRDLLEGDEIVLQRVTGETRRYRVIRFETVLWDAFTYPRDPARPLLALATCYPFGGTEYGGPWRRVAWAEEIA